MARGERNQPERNALRVKDREKGVKQNKGERRETKMKKSLYIITLISFFPSPHLAGCMYFTSLSFLSLFHPRARICPPACAYACVCEGGVKRERKERKHRGRFFWGGRSVEFLLAIEEVGSVIVVAEKNRIREVL